ncbi:uncharacterized protein BCR38DRAFT_405946 [Pseudomassariella vexata]|uniref:Uncharacterized protein n=1 Tax=Pseudomassariella vexata TaxID=1141098 RepID=A0A1Y2EFI3_9PEZI|nr:uncharacterized protein BCR38DRAFT_405946 [Pseudomassariella vexata]ORY70330.1 hypothetical protein BCR38DRAFT_405946 [Pseudomassariella vexata]
MNVRHKITIPPLNDGESFPERHIGPNLPAIDEWFRDETHIAASLWRPNGTIATRSLRATSDGPAGREKMGQSLEAAKILSNNLQQYSTGENRLHGDFRAQSLPSSSTMEWTQDNIQRGGPSGDEEDPEPTTSDFITVLNLIGQMKKQPSDLVPHSKYTVSRARRI